MPFPTTQWSLVLRAARDDAAGAAALAELCAAYWPAVHAFYRQQDLATKRYATSRRARRSSARHRSPFG